jgi:hypothetical protein
MLGLKSVYCFLEELDRVFEVLELTRDIDSDERVLKRVQFSIEVSNQQVIEFNQVSSIIEYPMLSITQYQISHLMPQSTFIY